MNTDTIQEAHCSIGGVGPIPKFLAHTCEYLTNKTIEPKVVLRAEEILQTELSPMSDARGTKEYKRLLARQLFFAHFIELFPDKIKMIDLI